MSNSGRCNVVNGLLYSEILSSQVQQEVLKIAVDSTDLVPFLEELLAVMLGYLREANEPNLKTSAVDCFYGGLLPGMQGSYETQEEVKALILEIVSWLKGLIAKVKK